MSIAIVNRIIFLLTGILAGYEIVAGMDDFSDLGTAMFTVSFGLLLLASLLLLLMGFEIMENDYVAVVTSLVPVSLSLGLVVEKLDNSHNYAILISVAFIIAVFLRFFSKGKIASLSLGVLHLLSGAVIFILPILLYAMKKADIEILFISLGGILIGIGGVFLGFLKIGKMTLRKEQIHNFFPMLMFLTTVLFILGLRTV